MSKTAMVRARLEPDLKDYAEGIFHRLGLNATQAITMFYRQAPYSTHPCGVSGGRFGTLHHEWDSAGWQHPAQETQACRCLIEIHQEDLMADWELAVSGQNPLPIRGLDQ